MIKFHVFVWDDLVIFLKFCHFWYAIHYSASGHFLVTYFQTYLNYRNCRQIHELKTDMHYNTISQTSICIAHLCSDLISFFSSTTRDVRLILFFSKFQLCNQAYLRRPNSDRAIGGAELIAIWHSICLERYLIAFEPLSHFLLIKWSIFDFCDPNDKFFLKITLHRFCALVFQKATRLFLRIIDGVIQPEGKIMGTRK